MPAESGVGTFINVHSRFKFYVSWNIYRISWTIVLTACHRRANLTDLDDKEGPGWGSLAGHSQPSVSALTHYSLMRRTAMAQPLFLPCCYEPKFITHVNSYPKHKGPDAFLESVRSCLLSFSEPCRYLPRQQPCRPDLHVYRSQNNLLSAGYQ